MASALSLINSYIRLLLSPLKVALEVLISAFSINDRNQIAVAAAASSWVATLDHIPNTTAESADAKWRREGLSWPLL